MPPPQSLIDAVKTRTLVPFVGAGLSLSVGGNTFPSWKGLIEQLAARLDKEAMPTQANDVRARLATNQYPEAAELAFASLTPSRFAEEMRKAFDRPQPQNADLSAVAALWRLKPSTVITTNYDKVLQWPSELRGRPYSSGVPPTLVHNNQPSLLQRVGRTDNEPALVWHLHGSVTSPDEFVLTEHQYETLYGGPGENDKKRLASYRFALDQLRSLLATHPFFFVGFSLEDPFLKRQLAYILDITSKQSPVSYLLLKKGEQDPAAFLAKYQVQIIEFETFGAPMVRAISEIAEAAWGRYGGSVSVPSAFAGMIDDVRALLGNAAPEPAVVGRAYNRWRPDEWSNMPLSGDGIELADRSATRLAGAMRQTDGYFPLIEFVREIGARLSPDERAWIEGWIAKAAAALGVDAADVDALKQGGFTPPRGTSADHYILVRCEDASAPDRWRVQGWVFSGGISEALFADEQEFGRGDLPVLAYQLLNTIESYGVDYGRTTIGFLAPRRLIVEAIHRIPPAGELNAQEEPLGCTLAVTVRSIERLGSPRTWRVLKAVWPALKASGNAAQALTDVLPPPPGAAVWLTPASASASLTATLQKNAVTCAVLSMPPGSTASGSMDLFDCVLRAGVPAIVWVRDDASGVSEQDARLRVEALLNDATAPLPQRLWKRRQAAATDTDPDNLLILLWDDAERVPPERDPANRASVARI